MNILVESIEKFVNQDELIDLMIKKNFKNVSIETYLVALCLYILDGKSDDKKINYSFQTWSKSS